MRFVAGIILFATLYFIANALVEGFTQDKDMHKATRIGLKVLVTLLLAFLLGALSKCGCTSEEEYSPSGKSTMEHYEPRF